MAKNKTTPAVASMAAGARKRAAARPPTPPTPQARPASPTVVAQEDVPTLLKTVERGFMRCKSAAAGFGMMQRAIEDAETTAAGGKVACRMEIPVFEMTARYEKEAVPVSVDMSDLSPEDVPGVLRPISFLLANQMLQGSKLVMDASTALHAIVSRSMGYREEPPAARVANPDEVEAKQEFAEQMTGAGDDEAEEHQAEPADEDEQG